MIFLKFWLFFAHKFADHIPFVEHLEQDTFCVILLVYRFPIKLMLADYNMQIVIFRIVFVFYESLNVAVIEFDYIDNFYTQ
jgi:hypothetical protein